MRRENRAAVSREPSTPKSVDKIVPPRWAIIPVQDLLGLGAGARMNTPGQSGDNWRWRMKDGQFDALPVKRLLEMTTTFGRT